jgi:hypothetical protein
MRPSIRLKPRAGLLVPYPGTNKPLPAEGANVTDSTYWRRRLRDGDVEVVSSPSASNPKPRRSADTEG